MRIVLEAEQVAGGKPLRENLGREHLLEIDTSLGSSLLSGYD